MFILEKLTTPSALYFGTDRFKGRTIYNSTFTGGIVIISTIYTGCDQQIAKKSNFLIKT